MLPLDEHLKENHQRITRHLENMFSYTIKINVLGVVMAPDELIIGQIEAEQPPHQKNENTGKT